MRSELQKLASKYNWFRLRIGGVRTMRQTVNLPHVSKRSAYLLSKLDQLCDALDESIANDYVHIKAKLTKPKLKTYGKKREYND